MNNKYFLLLMAPLCCLFMGGANKLPKLVLKEKHTLAIHEPSDICMHPNQYDLLIVSDNGWLYRTDSTGRVQQKAAFKGRDFEGVYANDTAVFVVDEMLRKIHCFDAATFNLQETKTVPYNGGRNKSFESMTFNRDRNTFVVITERDPAILFELNAELNTVNEIDISHIAGDIAAATYYNGYLWLLSDEDMQLIKLDAANYTVLQRWRVPVMNPEGLAFNSRGEILILSDDMEKMFTFRSVYE